MRSFDLKNEKPKMNILLKEQRKSFKFIAESKHKKQVLQKTKTAIAPADEPVPTLNVFKEAAVENIKEIKSFKVGSDESLLEQRRKIPLSEKEVVSLRSQNLTLPSNKNSNFVDIREFKLKKRMEIAQKKIDEQKSKQTEVSGFPSLKQRSAFEAKLDSLLGLSTDKVSPASASAKVVPSKTIPAKTQASSSSKPKPKSKSTLKKKPRIDPDILGKRKHFEDLS